MLCFYHSEYGDHAAAECRRARDHGDTNGYHAGWGICDGRVSAPSIRPAHRPCGPSCAMRGHAVGTIWRRSLRRVERRAAARRAILAKHLGSPCVLCLREADQLLREAVRLANNLSESTRR